VVKTKDVAELVNEHGIEAISAGRVGAVPLPIDSIELDVRLAVFSVVRTLCRHDWIKMGDCVAPLVVTLALRDYARRTPSFRDFHDALVVLTDIVSRCHCANAKCRAIAPGEHAVPCVCRLGERWAEVLVRGVHYDLR
jgi:hypothetical protein